MTIDREECDYMSCYCEENIYYLGMRLISTVEADDLKIVFISNKDRTVPLFSQRSANQQSVNGYPVVIWDYHVILMERRQQGWYVWDLDSTTDFPCPFEIYFNETFRPEICLKNNFKRFFRVLSVDSYFHIFSSDRSHMVKDGSYSMPPPQWPIIWKGEDTLQKLITMEPDSLKSQSNIYPEETFFINFCK